LATGSATPTSKTEEAMMNTLLRLPPPGALRVLLSHIALAKMEGFGPQARNPPVSQPVWREGGSTSAYQEGIGLGCRQGHCTPDHFGSPSADDREHAQCRAWLVQRQALHSATLGVTCALHAALAPRATMPASPPHHHPLSPPPLLPLSTSTLHPA
jgi:hypothetical protein